MSNRISPHFSRHEFACRCGCGFDTVDSEVLNILETVRPHYMVQVTITSGCRCEEHNKAVGGSKNSQHVKARAVDFQVKDREAVEVYDFLNSLFPDELGLGLYSGWIHLDTRPNGPARWNG